MNIVMILSTPLPPTEGIGFYCTNLARELVRGGHAVTLITRGGRQTSTMDHTDGYRVIHAAFLPVYPFHVHLHGVLLQPLINELCADTDVFNLHSPLVPPVSTGKPVLTTVHSPMLFDHQRTDVRSVQFLLGTLQVPVSASLERRLFKRSTAIVTVSKWVRDYLPLHYPGLARTPIQVVGNGYESNLFTTGASPDGAREPVALYVGRLGHGKGILDLVTAFRAVASDHPTARLRIVGDGPLRRRIELEIAANHLGDRVTMVGPLVGPRRHELADELRSCGVFVLPSYHEGLPTTLLEAMASGAPVVTTDANGCAELVQDGVTGRRVPVGDTRALAEAIRYMLQDHDGAQRLATAAAESVRERFAWPQVARRYVDVYKRMMA